MFVLFAHLGGGCANKFRSRTIEDQVRLHMDTMVPYKSALGNSEVRRTKTTFSKPRNDLDIRSTTTFRILSS